MPFDRTLAEFLGASEASPERIQAVLASLPAAPETIQREKTEVMRSAKFRRGQEFFREAVVNNFGGRCGVTGLGIRDLLIASHILPWAKYPAERLNVRNGLCLSRLHDAAFDCGLMSFDEGLRLVLSRRLKEELPQRAVAENFGAYEGELLRIPEDSLPPEAAFLAEHRAKVFQR